MIVMGMLLTVDWSPLATVLEMEPDAPILIGEDWIVVVGTFIQKDGEARVEVIDLLPDSEGLRVWICVIE